MTVIRSTVLAAVMLTALFNFTGCKQNGSTLASVEVTPAVQSMANNSTQLFIATGTFTNGMKLYWSQVVVWRSSDTSVARVSNALNLYGLVTSVGTGTAIITAYDEANNLSGSALLTVTDPESITVLPANPFMAVGTSHQFTALALFSNGTITQVITSAATWLVSSGVASVVNSPGTFANGIVTTGSVPGTVDIQAEYLISNGTSTTGKTTLTVTSTPLASIAVSPVAQVVSLSTTTLPQFTALGTFQDGSTEDMTKSVNWVSSDRTIATIDNAGIAQPVAAGTVTITARDPIKGVSGNTTLTITQ